MLAGELTVDGSLGDVGVLGDEEGVVALRYLLSAKWPLGGNLSYMGILVSVSSKGQIVIPASVRSQLGIDQGTQLVLEVEDGQILLRRKLTLDEVTGLAQSWLPPDREPILDVDAFYQEHRG